MTQLAEGSVIRVITQPRNQWVTLLDEVGYIEKFREDPPGFCDIHTITLEGGGKRQGWGTVPVSCLALELGPEWHEARAKIAADDVKREQEVLAYSKRYHEKVAMLASEHGITPEAIRTIIEAMRSV